MPVDPARVDRMSRALAHRRPEDRSDHSRLLWQLVVLDRPLQPLWPVV